MFVCSFYPHLHLCINVLTILSCLVTFIFIIIHVVITNPPADVQGCWGGISHFYCSTERNDFVQINWQIDGSSLTDVDMNDRGISIETNSSTSFLSITGLPINHGVHIGCIIIVSSPPYVESETAAFIVDDIPPVTGLNVTFNKKYTEMTVTWKKPSCLPAKYIYIVSINNGTNVTEGNTTGLAYSVTYYSCSTHNVSVVVVDNGPTQKNSQSMNVSRTPIGGEVYMVYRRVSVMLINVFFE